MTKARDIASAIPAPSTVSSAELGYLDGVTSAIQTQVDAKTAKSTLTTTGDIYYASAANTPARLGIGSTDQVLKVTGGVPVWATPAAGGDTFTAGKNKIINGAFDNWQRGTSFTSPSSAYTADRFVANAVTSDVVSQQTFTPGNTITGYEPQYFLRYATSANAGTRYFFQKIEDVRTFAGQTVVFSFWAKVNSGTATLTTYFYQQFGSGGSADAQSTSGTQTVKTSLQRFSFSITMPSVSGKTIGAGSLVQAAFSFTDISKNLDLWGFQLEAGSTATTFQTATGTLQGELAACQRYYYRFTTTAAYPDNIVHGSGSQNNTTNCSIMLYHPITMRAKASSIDYASLHITDFVTFTSAVSAASMLRNSTKSLQIDVTFATGGAANRPIYLLNDGSTGHLGVNAEL